MRARVAEHRVGGLLSRKVVYRVDLHGVSVLGPGEARTLIRWEWIDGIATGPQEVVVTSAGGEVRFPDGVFSLAPRDLAARLDQARSITARPEIIGDLAGRAGR